MSRYLPWVLGISASHNGAACLLKGDEIVCAIQEERLHRLKRQTVAGATPSLCVEYCLQVAGIKAQDLDLVAFNALRPMDSERQDIFRNPQLNIDENQLQYRRYSHHLCHAASAFAVSGFQTSDVLVLDGQGSRFSDLSEEEGRIMGGDSEEWECISFYQAEGVNLYPRYKQGSKGNHGRGLLKEYYPSYGETYRAVAETTFKEKNVPGKLMGLAPYGKPVLPVGNFFETVEGRIVFTGRFIDFLRTAGWPDEKEFHQNNAASVQRALEESALEFILRQRKKTQSENLCYAGGVALNSVLNERIVRESGYRNVFITPCAEDNGIALGAAFLGLWELSGTNTKKRLRVDSLGRSYSQSEIQSAIDRAQGIQTATDKDAAKEAARRLALGQCGAWFQGGSEFGPRALGHRSMIADPRRENIKDYINIKVKRREEFRPFAPSVLLEHVSDWFDTAEYAAESPFMLRVLSVKPEKRHLIPGVVHVDGTARIQTVSKENGPYYDLLAHFYRVTGIPMVLNTSLNVMGEPIAETPDHAIWCFLDTPLDFCVLHNYLIEKVPSYSFLNLVPKLNPMEVFINGKELADHYGPIPSNANIAIKTNTPWGKKQHKVRRFFQKHAEWIDGKRTNAEILELLNKDTKHSVNSFWWQVHIREMVRTGMVSIVKNPGA